MNSTSTIDYCLDASWILPVLPRGRLLSDCSLLIARDSIVGIVPTSDTQPNSTNNYTIKERVSLPGQLLMPGLINCHGHAAMSLLRGFADDMPLDDWLNKHIWPTEKQWVGEEFVIDGGELAMAEMLLSGTTSFADMYFYQEALASAVHRVGMRAQLFFPVFDFATSWARDAEEYIHKGLKLRDTYRSHPLIDVCFGPHAPYTVSDPILKKVAVYADELQTPLQIHLHETEFEVQQSLEQHGKRPLQRLADLGLISPLSQCVHMTQVTPGDMALIESYGASVIHCPRSNMKLASGACPVAALLDKGINVALGTDGAASNNSLDMFAEVQMAALLAKLVSGNAASLDAHSVIEMATINGAKAINQEDKLGSLETGKQADVIAIDLTAAKHLPLHHPVSQLVYTDAGNSVSHVWVAGQMLVKDRQLTTLNLQDVRQKAEKWQQRLGD